MAKREIASVMQVCHSSDPSALPRGGRVFAIGTFDGVHRGHRALLARASLLATRLAGGPEGGVAPWALTFAPHPAKVLAPARAPLLLGDLEDRLRWFRAAGVQGVWVLPFDRALAALEPVVFFERVLVAGGARGLVVGHDFTFGRDRMGHPETLRSLARGQGLQVEVLAPVRSESGAIISSTEIRGRVRRGDLEGAREMLGREVEVSGIVQPGAGRGAGLGFATANLLPEGRTIPGAGVYAGLGRLEGEGRRQVAAINVGVAPTFGALDRPQIEAHLLDQPEGSLAGQGLHLTFLRRLRGERRFTTAEALMAQIARDVAAARWIAASLMPAFEGEGLP